MTRETSTVTETLEDSSTRSSSVDSNIQTAQAKSLFRGQMNMKPQKLQRGASLKEITTFVTTFNNYITHGYPGDIPPGAVHNLLILSLDDSWIMALEYRCLDINTDLKVASTL